MKGLLRYWGDTGEEKKEPVETHYVLLYNHSSRSIQIELRWMRLETREAKLLAIIWTCTVRSWPPMKLMAIAKVW